MEENKNQNEKYIIVSSDEDNGDPEKKMTWAKYWHFVGHYKWWIIGISAVGLIGAGLVTYLGVNSKKTLSTDITTHLAVNNGRYFDGSAYDYHDIVSLDNVSKTLSSDAEFSSFDAEKIMDKGVVSITQQTETVNGVTKPVADAYTISTNTRYFKNADTARNFVRALIENEVKTSAEKVSSYQVSTYLPLTLASFDVLTFNERTADIYNQYNNLRTAYEGLNSTFNGSLVVDGKNLASYLNEFNSKYNRMVMDSLAGTQLTNLYVGFDGTKDGAEKALDQYKTTAESLSEEYKDDINKVKGWEKQVTELAKISKPGEQTDATIASLSDAITSANDRMAEIEQQLGKTGYILDKNTGNITLNTTDDSYISKLQKFADNWNGNASDEESMTWYRDGQAFASRLDSYYTSLTEDSEAFSKVYRQAYIDNKNYITPARQDMGEVNGGFPTAGAAAIGLLVFYLISSLGFAAYGVSKQNEEARKKAGEEVPAETK